MKTFTIEDIRGWNPCYDPGRHLPEGWSGTAVDLLKLDTIPPRDKLWVVLREEVLDAKTLRLFAVYCARQVEHLLTDDRSKRAIDVAEKYAHGQATDQELADAEVAAWGAAGNAAYVARAAAAAAWDAARDAAAVARAADTAADAARAAAGDAARAAQVAQLLKMLEEKCKHRKKWLRIGRKQ